MGIQLSEIIARVPDSEAGVVGSREGSGEVWTPAVC